MTATETSRPDRLPGAPAWLLTLVQAALLGNVIMIAWRSTNSTNQWILAALAIAAAGWAILRPDSPATAFWLIIIGAWWLTSLNAPSTTATTQAALLIGAVHYLTAIRANLHRATRMRPTLLLALVATLAGICLATLIADITIRVVAASPITNDTWTLAWSVAALIVPTTLATFFTRNNTT